MVSRDAVQYIDTAMVGSLGTQATAAVGATTTIGWLIGGSIGAFAIGFLAMISKACGAEDPDTAQRTSAQAVLSVLVIGSVCTLLTTALSGLIPGWMQLEESIRPVASRYFLVLYLPMLPRFSLCFRSIISFWSTSLSMILPLNSVLMISSISDTTSE